MSDKIYELFNNTSFDEGDFKSVEGELTESDKKRVKKSVRKRINNTLSKRMLIAACVALAVLACTISVKPAFAQNIIEKIPFLDAAYEKLGYYKEYEDFSDYIGMSKKYKGYTFTIDKLVADRDTVVVTMRISKPGLYKSGNFSPDSMFMITPHFFYLGRDVISDGSSSGQIIDENTSIFILSYDTLSVRSLSKWIKMRIDVYSEGNENIKVSFDMYISREKLDNQTIVKKNAGKSSVGKQIAVKIDQLKVSPVNTEIYYTYTGTLPYGNTVHFYVYDDKGRIYYDSSSSMYSGKHGKSAKDPVGKDAKKLYIIPYIEKDTEDKTILIKLYPDILSKYFDLNTRKEFDFNEYGKINVYNIERSSNSIRIYYSFKGTDSVLNKICPINLSQKFGNSIIWLSNTNAKLYKFGLSNYCVKFSNISPGEEYVYSVGTAPLYKAVDGKALVINLKR